jgi:hypothetical protein
VNDGRGLQSMARALRTHVVPRQPPELVVDQRHEPPKGVLVAAPQLLQQEGYFSPGGFHSPFPGSLESGLHYIPEIGEIDLFIVAPLLASPRIGGEVNMPRTYTLTITFWLVLTTAGSVAGQTGDLAVRVYDYAGVPGKVMTAAEDEARRLLHRAGIETEWSGCPKNPNERDRYPNCQEPLGEADVILHVMPQPVEEYQVTSNGFGLTLQSGKGGIAEHVYVFYDRVKKTAGKVDQLPPATLLGYVIAHEIGHLLLGPDSHSSRGIMRARWGREDLEQMQRGKLAFLEEQAAIMRARLEQRTRITAAR